MKPKGIAPTYIAVTVTEMAIGLFPKCGTQEPHWSAHGTNLLACECGRIPNPSQLLERLKSHTGGKEAVLTQEHSHVQQNRGDSTDPFVSRWDLASPPRASLQLVQGES